MHSNASCLDQTQGKLGVTDLHRQWLAPTRASSQHTNRLSRYKPQLAQTPYRRFTYLSRTDDNTIHQRLNAIRELRQKHAKPSKVGQKVAKVLKCK
jgi:hypothetical protein